MLSWGYGKPGQLGRIPTKQMRHNREEDMLEFGPISFRGIAGEITPTAQSPPLAFLVEVHP